MLVIYFRKFPVDLNDRAISLPVITHNIELGLKGQPLCCCLILNFYFECNHQFYSRHQTLNTNISILNSLKGISLISAANAGFVFFISFTSLSLTFIMYPSYHIWEQVSSAWCLVLVACGLAPFGRSYCICDSSLKRFWHTYNSTTWSTLSKLEGFRPFGVIIDPRSNAIQVSVQAFRRDHWTRAQVWSSNL